MIVNNYQYHGMVFARFLQTGTMNLAFSVIKIFDNQPKGKRTMDYRTKTRLIVITIAAMLLPLQSSHAATMRIDVTQSIVYTTNSSNWSPSWGMPSDLVEIPISGIFDLTIKPGVINVLNNNYLSPNRIQFTNISVPTSGNDGRIWQFPSFEGFFSPYFPSSFDGSEDYCASFQYYSNGSCWSAGNYGSYSGTWDGSTLILSGSKNPDSFTGNNGFYYSIVATPVPLPSAAWLLGAGLAGLTGVARKRKA